MLAGEAVWAGADALAFGFVRAPGDELVGADVLTLDAEVQKGGFLTGNQRAGMLV